MSEVVGMQLHVLGLIGVFVTTFGLVPDCLFSLTTLTTATKICLSVEIPMVLLVSTVLFHFHLLFSIFSLCISLIFISALLFRFEYFFGTSSYDSVRQIYGR